MKKSMVLIADADERLRGSLGPLLLRHGYGVAKACDKASALRFFETRGSDLVIIGSLRDDPEDALEVARTVHKWDRWVPILLLAANSSEDLAIAALRAGVTDYFKHPVVLEDLVARIEQHLAALHPSPPPASEVISSSPPLQPLLVGDSSAIQEIKAYITQVASTDSTVLITGETGTGKELTAEMIHRSSPRRDHPFVCINCAAIPESLLESELFGHERGAFTGAHALREGRLKLADGGTAFFDEVGDMPPEGQAKILRAIEGKEVHRLGGKGRVPLNVRFIAATNQDLEQRVSDGRFRKDLYYRLNVAHIHLPALRERKEDIPPLFHHYIRELSHRFGREVDGFSEEVLDPLLRYEWPGNVRELKNVLEAMFITLHSRRISLSDLPPPFRSRLAEIEGRPEDERSRLLSALLATKWNKSRAAQRLHWSRMTLYRKMAKYQLMRRRNTEDAAAKVPERDP